MPERFLCSLASINDGAGVVLNDVPAGDVQDSRRSIILLRQHDGCLAFENRCPHFGVPLAQKTEQLILKPHQSLSCNVHYARFRWQDGVCEFGDCEGESLTPVNVVIRSGDIFLVEDSMSPNNPL